MGNVLGGGAQALAILKKFEDLKKEMKFHVGDKIENEEIFMFGDVTAGNTNLRLQIVLPKQVGDDVASVKLTSSGFFTIRGINGYVEQFTYANELKIQDIWDDAFLTPQIFIKKESGRILLSIVKVSGYEGVAENTPMIANVDGLTIEFL